MTKKKTNENGDTFLASGTIYANLEEAMHAASCLCGLDAAGATIYGTTSGPDVAEETGEAYRIACAAVRIDGTTWEVPGAPYEPVYTITHAKFAAQPVRPPATKRPRRRLR